MLFLYEIRGNLPKTGQKVGKSQTTLKYVIAYDNHTLMWLSLAIIIQKPCYRTYNSKIKAFSRRKYT